MLPADLLDRLLPATEPIAHWEQANPPRDLPDGAEVTRFAPSPTGFLHIGGVYTAMVAKELAVRSGGSYFVRVEDTDQARVVAGSDQQFAAAFAHFGIGPTEPADAPWGPYRQSERAAIYRSHVRHLLEHGRAYPCFASKEELEDITARQQAAKVDIGYWGEWAVWRDADADRVAAALDEGRPYVVRFRAPDEPGRVAFVDEIRGRIEADDNRNDVVLLKTSADPTPLPTYHLAHVVDDHLMRVTLVLRGDEWVPSVPLHLQLFDALGFEPVRYAHLAPLMKGEGKSRRKLSKRKDPEASVDFWMAEGYPVGAVRHYLRGLANSRLADLPFDEADAEPLRLEEFGVAGPLVDIPKLDDISADYVAQLPAVEIRDALLAWAEVHDAELAGLLRQHGDQVLAMIDVDRVDTDRVRKDIVKWSVFRERYGFFFPELFVLVDDPADERFLGVPPEVVAAFAADFVAGYDADTTSPAWFDQVRTLAERHGFALDRKAYKADPDAFHGTMREASNIVRVTLTGSGQSPSLDQVCAVLGADEVRRRVGAPAR
ncbi:MAG TPA: glutamate--tRNA ligase family protein [Acidimicrobiales bacterium]|nr:glutamate--tRNA ligase family protein [Acidimicrobiales bacterium]